MHIKFITTNAFCELWKIFLLFDIKRSEDGFEIKVVPLTTNANKTTLNTCHNANLIFKDRFKIKFTSNEGWLNPANNVK